MQGCILQGAYYTITGCILQGARGSIYIFPVGLYIAPSPCQVLVGTRGDVTPLDAVGYRLSEPGCFCGQALSTKGREPF